MRPIGAALAIASILPAKVAAAQDLPVPTSTQIVATCPSIGITGARAGAARGEQPAALMDGGGTTGLGVPLFEEVAPEFTPWSEQLSALAWRAAEPEGADGQAWFEAVSSVLEADGWAVVSEQGESSFGLAAQFMRSFELSGGAREMMVELVVNGAFELRCGDRQLMILAQAEQDGQLAQGSRRPVAPAPAGPSARDIAICDRPEVQQIFASRDRLRAAGGDVEGLLPFPDSEFENARYQERLHTWLAWKMLASGKIDEDAVWKVEEQAAPEDGHDVSNGLADFLADASAALDAQEAGDGRNACRSIIAVLTEEAHWNAARARRLAKVNAALEGEAVRRGIALD